MVIITGSSLAESHPPPHFLSQSASAVRIVINISTKSRPRQHSSTHQQRLSVSHNIMYVTVDLPHPVRQIADPARAAMVPCLSATTWLQTTIDSSVHAGRHTADAAQRVMCANTTVFELEHHMQLIHLHTHLNADWRSTWAHSRVCRNGVYVLKRAIGQADREKSCFRLHHPFVRNH